MSGIIQTNASRVLTFAAVHGFTAGTLPFPVILQDDANAPAALADAANGRHAAIAIVESTTTIRIFSTEVEWVVPDVRTTFSAQIQDCLYTQDGGGLGISPGTVADPVFIISGDDTVLYVGNDSSQLSSTGLPPSGKPYELRHLHGQNPTSNNGMYIYDAFASSWVQVSTDTGNVAALMADFTATENAGKTSSTFDASPSIVTQGRTLVKWTWNFTLVDQSNATVSIEANAGDPPASWIITDSRGAGATLDAADLAGTPDNITLTHSGANWWGDINVSLTIEDDQSETSTK